MTDPTPEEIAARLNGDRLGLEVHDNHMIDDMPDEQRHLIAYRRQVRKRQAAHPVTAPKDNVVTPDFGNTAPDDDLPSAAETLAAASQLDLHTVTIIGETADKRLFLSNKENLTELCRDLLETAISMLPLSEPPKVS